MNKCKSRLTCFFVQILVILVATTLVSCETREGEPAYLGYEYFGQTEGRWLIYEVDSTVYDDFLEDIFHYNYQVKEVNSHFFINAQGDSSMRIERFYRANENEPWQIKNIWTSELKSKRALKTEENITYVKLAFPLKQNHTWNGNLYNNKQSQTYRVTDIHIPSQEGVLAFDSTLTVLQKEFFTLIGEEFQYEVYAAGIGMIRKKYLDLAKEVDGTITRGVDYSYSLIAYGFNNN